MIPICPVVMGLAGPALSPDETHLLRQERPAGVILFKRNLSSADQVFALCHDVRKALGPRALIAIDQEGGRVDRLAVLGVKSPAPRLLGRRGAAACRAAGKRTGLALRALGINWDLAPCVDLGLHPHDVSGIGDRAFARYADRVTALGGAFLQGLEAAEVPGCLKHFPGHGRARLDSHVGMPQIPANRHALDRDLTPYRKLSRPTRAVMVAHCTYPALDCSGLPATLSRVIVTDFLRGKLHHRGIAVADDMEMGAIVMTFGMQEACKRALHAGNDLLLVCYSRPAIETALGVARGRGSERLGKFIASLPSPPRRYQATRVQELLRDLAL